MSFIIFAWIASLAFGLVGVVAKLTTKHQISNPWLFNFFWKVFVIAITVPVALANGASIPTTWTNIVLAGLFFALGDLGYVFSIKHLDISVMMPLFNFRTVIVAFLGAIFLQEFYSVNAYMLMGLILVAGFFITMDERFSLRSFFQKGVAIMVVTVTVLAIAAIFISRAVNESGLWTATMWMFLIAQIPLFATVPLFKKELSKLKKPQLMSLFVIAILGTIGFLAENQAFAENVTITSIIISLPISMIIAFAFSRFAPQLLEKHTLKVYAVRFAAAAVMIGATLKLTL